MLVPSSEFTPRSELMSISVLLRSVLLRSVRYRAAELLPQLRLLGWAAGCRGMGYRSAQPGTLLWHLTASCPRVGYHEKYESEEILQTPVSARSSPAACSPVRRASLRCGVRSNSGSVATLAAAPRDGTSPLIHICYTQAGPGCHSIGLNWVKRSSAPPSPDTRRPAQGGSKARCQHCRQARGHICGHRKTDDFAECPVHHQRL